MTRGYSIDDLYDTILTTIFFEYFVYGVDKGVLDETTSLQRGSLKYRHGSAYSSTGKMKASLPITVSHRGHMKASRDPRGKCDD